MKLRREPKKPCVKGWSRRETVYQFEPYNSHIPLKDLKQTVLHGIDGYLQGASINGDNITIRNTYNEGTANINDIVITTTREWGDTVTECTLIVNYQKREDRKREEMDLYLIKKAKYDKWYSENKTAILKELEDRKKKEHHMQEKKRLRIIKEMKKLEHQLNKIP